ncbi:hypothetical protein SAMN04488601_1012771 [Paenibacillus sp. 453mf]|nr:hypothetical protein SAMN04488601_1012771 [Paenibacillus sp. 453mf]
MSKEMNEEVNEQMDQAPGWDAIDEALKPIYGDQEPKDYGTLLPYSLGGQDPLDGISAYKSERGGRIGISYDRKGFEFKGGEKDGIFNDSGIASQRGPCLGRA